MTIAELRTLFIERSGDLNIEEADIDRHVNSGIELLDLLTDYSHAPAKYYAELAVEDYISTFTSKNRTIKEVWIIDSVDGRSKLEKVKYSDLREEYDNVPDTASGKPLFYAPNINRADPIDFDKTNLPAAFQPFIDTVATAYDVDGILFMPPADEVYVLEIIGKFHSPVLSNTYTQNWWSINYSDLVMLAALYRLESHYRNTEGMKGYMDAITPLIKGIDYDRAEEESQDLTTMQG